MRRRDGLRLGAALLAAAFLPAVSRAAGGDGMGTLTPAPGGALRGLGSPAALPAASALARLRGKAVLLNFWATWCPPCREEMPVLHRLAVRLRDRPFSVLTVAVADHRKAVDDFLAESGAALPVVLDPESDILRAVGVRVLPTTFLLDARHRPRWQVVGPFDWEAPPATAALERLIPPLPVQEKHK